MKHVYFLPFLLIMVGSFWQCANKPNTEPQVAPQLDVVFPEGQQPKLSPTGDYLGTYTGMLHCADCEGMETTIKLDYESEFTIQSIPVGRSAAKPKNQKGLYSVQTHGAILTLLEVDPPNRFQIGDNILYPLDPEGNRISGDQAGKYFLKKK